MKNLFSIFAIFFAISCASRSKSLYFENSSNYEDTFYVIISLNNKIICDTLLSQSSSFLLLNSLDTNKFNLQINISSQSRVNIISLDTTISVGSADDAFIISYKFLRENAKQIEILDSIISSANSSSHYVTDSVIYKPTIELICVPK